MHTGSELLSDLSDILILQTGDPSFQQRFPFDQLIVPNITHFKTGPVFLPAQLLCFQKLVLFQIYNYGEQLCIWSAVVPRL